MLDDGSEDTFTVLGVQYNLGSRSRMYAEYWSSDPDGEQSEDEIYIGLRHDF